MGGGGNKDEEITLKVWDREVKGLSDTIRTLSSLATCFLAVRHHTSWRSL